MYIIYILIMDYKLIILIVILAVVLLSFKELYTLKTDIAKSVNNLILDIKDAHVNLNNKIQTNLNKHIISVQELADNNIQQLGKITKLNTQYITNNKTNRFTETDMTSLAASDTQDINKKNLNIFEKTVNKSSNYYMSDESPNLEIAEIAEIAEAAAIAELIASNNKKLLVNNTVNIPVYTSSGTSINVSKKYTNDMLIDDNSSSDTSSLHEVMNSNNQDDQDTQDTQDFELTQDKQELSSIQNADMLINVIKSIENDMLNILVNNELNSKNMFNNIALVNGAMYEICGDNSEDDSEQEYINKKNSGMIIEQISDDKDSVINCDNIEEVEIQEIKEESLKD